MPPSHLILCRPLLLPPSIFPSIRVFSSESALCIRWLKYWSFSFSISPSNEHSGLISFRMDWLGLLAVQGTLKCLLQHQSSKASILRCSAFFIVPLSASGNLLYDSESSSWGSVTTWGAMGREGGFKRGGTHVYLWPIHVAVWQKPTQYCKAIISQLRKKEKIRKDLKPLSTNKDTVVSDQMWQRTDRNMLVRGHWKMCTRACLEFINTKGLLGTQI